MSKISIVMPLYNKAAYIERAINSVRCQTEKDFEMVIVDDGSTDGSGDIVAAIKDSRIRLIKQENKGEGAARNRGIAEAKGDLIAFLDADDAWKPRFLETIIKLRNKFPQTGTYATAYVIINPNGTKKEPRFQILPENINEGVIYDYFRKAYQIPVTSSSVAVPKIILEEIGGFPKGMPMYADLVTWLKIALRYDIAWSKEVMACYHKDAGTRVARLKCQEQEPVVSQAARQALASGLVRPAQAEDLREYAAYFEVIAAVHCLCLGNREMARHLLELSRGTNRFAAWWWICRLITSLPVNLSPVLSWLWQTRQNRKVDNG